MLTSHAKKLFEEYCLDNVKSHLVRKHKIKANTVEWVFDEEFYNLPLSMQFGVYEDFAGSLGYDMIIIEDFGKYISEINLKEYEIEIGGNIWEGFFKTKQEARQQAIKQLNILINNKY